jgi:hypothetical protein
MGATKEEENDKVACYESSVAIHASGSAMFLAPLNLESKKRNIILPPFMKKCR